MFDIQPSFKFVLPHLFLIALCLFALGCNGTGNAGGQTCTIAPNGAMICTSGSIQPALAAPALLSVSVGSTAVTSTYDFGTVTHGKSSDATFTVTNGGGTAVGSLSASSSLPASPFSYKGGTFPGTGGTCGTSLAAGASCTFVVTFSPASVASFTSSLSFGYNDGTASQTWTPSLTGTGGHDCSVTTSLYSDINQWAFQSIGQTYSGMASAFTLSSAQLLKSIDVEMYADTGVVGTVNVYIQTDSAGLPSGTSVTGADPAATITASSLPTSSSTLNQTITLTSPVVLAAGSYWLVFVTSGVGGNSSYVYIGLDDDGPSGSAEVTSTTGNAGSWGSATSSQSVNFDLNGCN